MKNSKKKSVIICGGSSGLGYEITKLFVKEGFQTFILSRNKKKINLAIKSIKSKNLSGYKCDLSSHKEVEAVFRKLLKLNNNINFLICVAGNGKDFFSKSQNYKNYYSAYQKNFFTAINPIEILSNKLKNFNIIVISSIAGYFNGNAPLSYSLAKNSLINYCRESSEDFAKKNIRINSISPGHIMQKNNLWYNKFLKNKKKTNRFINSNVALKRFCKPSDIINVISFLINKENDYITGIDIKIDGKTK